MKVKPETNLAWGADADKNKCWMYPHQLPDYLNDLNAMHDAAMLQPEAIRKAIRFYLYEITDQMSAHDATASQRAEAFLKSKGLWK